MQLLADGEMWTDSQERGIARRSTDPHRPETDVGPRRRLRIQNIGIRRKNQ